MAEADIRLHCLSNTTTTSTSSNVGYEKKKGSYNCGICGKMLTSRHLLSRHYQIKHSKNKKVKSQLPPKGDRKTWICPFCTQTGTSNPQDLTLRQHLEHTHSIISSDLDLKVHKCPEKSCTFSTIYPIILDQHKHWACGNAAGAGSRSSYKESLKGNPESGLEYIVGRNQVYKTKHEDGRDVLICELCSKGSKWKGESKLRPSLFNEVFKEVQKEVCTCKNYFFPMFKKNNSGNNPSGASNTGGGGGGGSGHSEFVRTWEFQSQLDIL